MALNDASSFKGITSIQKDNLTNNLLLGVQDFLSWGLLQVGAFQNEIKTLDPLIKTSSNWDQALICTALMALKKYGCDNEDVLEGIRILDDRELTGKKGKEWDGLTHIIWEWTNDILFKSKTTTWNAASGLDNTVAYCCYWFDKYMANQKGSKLGRNWQDVPKRWKDEQVTTLNALFNMKTPVTV